MKILLWLVAALAISIAMEWAAASHDRAHVFPGFKGAAGFLGCLALVAVAKTLGKWILREEENETDGD